MSLHLQSPVFSNFSNLKVDYPVESPIRPIPVDHLKSALKSLSSKTMTFYDRISDELATKHYASGKTDPGVDVAVKVLAGFGDDCFFFVYKSYGEKLNDRRAWLKCYVDSLEGNRKFRVKSLMDVGVGHLFGVHVGGDRGFVRVRSTSLDILTGEIGYFAVDEGFAGTCTHSDLYFLTEYCCGLDMLVVPGKFASPPTPSLTTKLKEKKYVVANVLEPCVHDDHGVRIVKFCC